MTIRCWFVAVALGACTPAEPPAVLDEDPEDPVITDTDTGTPPAPTDTDTDTGEPAPAVPAMTVTLTPETLPAGMTAELAVQLENFTIVDPTAVPAPLPAEGEGHFHVYLDGAYLLAAWTSPVLLQTESSDAGKQYELRVTLVDSGHTELDPAVDAVVTLTVE